MQHENFIEFLTPFLLTVLGILLVNFHQVLSILALIISIIYTIRKWYLMEKSKNRN